MMNNSTDNRIYKILKVIKKLISFTFFSSLFICFGFLFVKIGKFSLRSNESIFVLMHIIPFILLGYVFMFIPIVAVIGEAKAMINNVKKNKNIKELKENGTIVQASIDNISRNFVVIDLFDLECSYLDMQAKCRYEFKKSNIDFNIEKIVEINNLTTIPVYMDPNDKSNYYIDTDSLRVYLGN